jgi:hypothetical protein
MKGRSHNSHEEHSAIDTVSVHKRRLKRAAKDHFLKERSERHQEEPCIRNAEVGCELRCIKPAKVMRRPEIAINEVLPNGDNNVRSDWKRHRGCHVNMARRSQARSHDLP